MSFGDEPIAYIWEGDVVCDRCWEAPPDKDDDAVHAVFDDAAFDYPLHCSYCREFLGGDLTKEGIQFIKDQWLEGRWRDVKRMDEYMRHYHWVDWYFIHTFWGWMDPSGEFKDR